MSAVMVMCHWGINHRNFFGISTSLHHRSSCHFQATVKTV